MLPGTSPSYHPRNRRTSNRSRRRLGILIFFLVVLGLAFLWHQQQDASLTPGAEPTPLPSPSPSPSPTLPPFSPTELTKNLQAIVKAHPDLMLGISFTDLASGAHTDINGDTPFIAASTTKLIAATNFLQKVEAGTYSLNMKLGSYTADFQLQQLINQSNNVSWEYFNNLLSFKGEEAFTRSLGITSFNTDNNSIAPNDMVRLLEQLYTGKILNAEHTELVLSHMHNTNEETIMPPALPQEATFYHKYGEYEDNMHDVAIIKQNGRTYFLAIYTNGKGVYQYEQRKLVIQALTKAVVDAVREQSGQ